MCAWPPWPAISRMLTRTKEEHMQGCDGLEALHPLALEKIKGCLHMIGAGPGSTQDVCFEAVGLCDGCGYSVGFGIDAERC